MKYKLIGAGSDLGVNVNGARDGAKKILDNIDEVDKVLLEQDNSIIKSNDKNDLEKNLDELNLFNEKLYNEIMKYKNDHFVITVGGDHSVAIASALASSKNDSIGLIWIDAHPDYNTFDTTITGNLHGLPCACVTNYDCVKLRPYYSGNFINPKNTVIVGARSIDKLEMVNLKDAGVTIYTTEDINKYGVNYIMDKAFKIALNNTNKVHISYDLDVIDPVIAPGVSVPEINGITEKQAYEITDYLKNNLKNICALDIVEYNPLKDINDKTLNIATNIINKIITKE